MRWVGVAGTAPWPADARSSADETATTVCLDALRWPSKRVQMSGTHDFGKPYPHPGHIDGHHSGDQRGSTMVDCTTHMAGIRAIRRPRIAATGARRKPSSAAAGADL